MISGLDNLHNVNSSYQTATFVAVRLAIVLVLPILSTFFSRVESRESKHSITVDILSLNWETIRSSFWQVLLPHATAFSVHLDSTWP